MFLGSPRQAIGTDKVHKPALECVVVGQSVQLASKKSDLGCAIS